MLTSVYDQDHNGIVDNAEKVNNHTVETDVPQDAVFTDTTYTAGTGIDITNGVISNTQTSAEWGNITGTLSNQTDLDNALSEKQETIYQQDTAPSNPSEDDLWIDTDEPGVTNIDNTVSTSSTNPVENQAITNYVNDQVSGNLVVDSIRSKNIFGNYTIVNGYLFETRMSIRTGASDRLAFILCKPNTTYTISRIVITSSFRVSDYTSIPTMTDSYVDYPVPTVIENNNGTTITYTTSSTAKYLVIHYGNTNNDSATNMINTLKTMQVEEGTTASTFSPYQNLTGKENYTTREQVIGTWTNGKPLYRKVVATTLPNGSNDILIDENIQTIWLENGYFNSPSGNTNRYFSIPFINDSAKRVLGWGLSTGYFHLINEISSYNGVNCYLSLVYTKTTD